MTKGASYLDRPTFRLTSSDLSLWGPPAFALMILGAIGLVYLCLGVAYLAMNLEHKRLYGTPEPTAVTSVTVSDQKKSPAAVDDEADPDGNEHITFARDSQNHYWRENSQAGHLLILTGMVRNSYPEPRSFIRLHAHLLANDGTSLADRFVYAGNILTDKELTTLPPKEILHRLSAKGGQEGRNIDIPSGAEIPFMIVFDKLPEDMSEYRIDSVGSSPVR